jgi:hypothetical protein
MKQDNRTVDEIIESLPKDEKIIIKRLRALVLECLPYVTEQNSYGVPFYRRNRMICFIWPPSVSWGPKKADYETRGVTLGFCQGNKMSNDQGLLLSEGRKQVYCMYFHHVSEIDDQSIRSLLFEADLVDGDFRKKAAKGRKGVRGER